jgi:general secretion pathway protein K
MHQKGFVLVATIWLLAILAMAAGFFALWLDRSLKLAQIQHDRSQGALDILATKSTLLYMLSTNGISQAGLRVPTDSAAPQESSISLDDFFLGAPNTTNKMNDMGEIILTIDGNEIHFDNTSYKGIGSARFAIQDNAGLISLTQLNKTQLELLMQTAGYTNVNTNELIDKLQDYIDSDDLHRLNGAESYHYRQEGIAPPTNEPLKTSREIQHILGWNQYPNLLTNQKLAQSLTVVPNGQVNLNTATRETLKIELGLDEISIDKILEEREKAPFQTVNEVNSRTKLPLIGLIEKTITFPSSELRIYFWHKGARLEREISIKLNDLAHLSTPWLIGDDFSQSLSEQHVQAESQKPKTNLFN